MQIGPISQLTPASNTDTTLYTGRVNRKVLGTISAVNTGASPVTIRMAIIESERAVVTQDWQWYDFSLVADGKPRDWSGILVGPNEVIKVRASANTVNFQFSGVESYAD